MKKTIIIMMLMTIGSLASLPQSITREDLKNGIWLYIRKVLGMRGLIWFTQIRPRSAPMLNVFILKNGSL